MNFAELGVPFPLFEGTAEQAREYCGVQTCSLCRTAGQHCFQLGIGCAIVVECSNCHAHCGLDADDQESGNCLECGATVPFPQADSAELAACYACLRAGRCAITKDTELGMISWQQASAGVTLGLPGLNRDDFEMVPGEDDWVGARLPREAMFELLRTPTYQSIQGEIWQFCCNQPMVFVGEWSRDEFSHRAPDGDGRRYFESIVQDVIPGLWEDELHDVTGIYVFRCPTCERRTAHWDLA